MTKEEIDRIVDRILETPNDTMKIISTLSKEDWQAVQARMDQRSREAIARARQKVADAARKKKR